MGWNIDKRLKRGGFWECREKRRQHNAKRISLFGERMLMPDMEFRSLAAKLREDRNGRTES